MNKLQDILNLYYKYEFIEIVERTDVDGKCITREFILASDTCKYLNKIYSLIKIDLKTGRTHQIRVHFSYLKWPLVGDLVYGGRELLGLRRPFLQAAELQFEHPVSGQQMSFEIELANDLREVMEKL